jgi:hypothetical protein
MSEEAAVPETTETSFEEKFLGVRTRIGNSGEEEEVPDVEIVDDRPEEDRRPPQKAEVKEEEESEEDELEGYSDKVKKRINKLRYQQHEERRQREAAEKMREEAVRVAQNLQQQNQQYQDVIRNGEAMLVTQIKDRAALAVEKAKGQYASAHEAGETDKLLEAQDALISAQAELREANNQVAAVEQRQKQYEAYVQQTANQNPQQGQYVAPQQEPVQQPAAPQPSEKATQWAKDNPWFTSEDHKDMTALAYGVHEKLVKDHGFDPDSNEYFQEIDRTMRSKFPEYFGEDGGEGQAPSSSRKASTVVAPSSRSNGAKPRKVRLTSTQAKLAKRLGLSNEQYAKQLIKEGV